MKYTYVTITSNAFDEAAALAEETISLFKKYDKAEFKNKIHRAVEKIKDVYAKEFQNRLKEINFEIELNDIDDSIIKKYKIPKEVANLALLNKVNNHKMTLAVPDPKNPNSKYWHETKLNIFGLHNVPSVIKKINSIVPVDKKEEKLKKDFLKVLNVLDKLNDLRAKKYKG